MLNRKCALHRSKLSIIYHAGRMQLVRTVINTHINVAHYVYMGYQPFLSPSPTSLVMPDLLPKSNLHNNLSMQNRIFSGWKMKTEQKFGNMNSLWPGSNGVYMKREDKSVAFLAVGGYE